MNRKNIKKRYIIIPVVILIVLGIILGTILSIRAFHKKHQIANFVEEAIDEIEEAVNLETEEVIDYEIILRESFTKEGTLVTYSYQSEKTHVSENALTIFEDLKLPLTTNRVVMNYKYNLNAGIDFTKVEVLKAEKEKVVLKVPDAYVFDEYTSDIELLEEKNNIFNPIPSDYVVEELTGHMEENKNEALNNGVLELAKNRAEALLSGMVKAVVSEDTVVEFK